MALVERIMGWGREPGDTEPPTFEPEARWVPVHNFFAAQLEVLQGNLTVAQVKAFLSMTEPDCSPSQGVPLHDGGRRGRL
jgi:hypothetical protein